MTSLANIESTDGVLHVRIALHGRKALNASVGTKGLVSGLAKFERAFSVSASTRLDPATHNGVRSKLVLMIEDLLDGKVSFMPTCLPEFMAYGVTWCLVNHYRDGAGTRRAILQYLEGQGIAHLGLMTTANDQMALTVSPTEEVERLRGAVAAMTHGTKLGLVVGDDGEPVVTAYEEARPN